ncbi:MAG: ester cyclase [Xanthomonadales bacterium]|nr:ester cyclase [Xanthomonadales bacterium]
MLMKPRSLKFALLMLAMLASFAQADPDVQDAAKRLAVLEKQAALEAANKELVQRWLEELWNQGDYRVASELLAANFERHSAGYPASGPDAYVAIIKSCHDGFPDTRITQVDELIADGDLVFVRWRWTGTHQAEFRGVPATGKAIDVLGEDVIRIADGKITDVWPLFDPLRLMLQIGAVKEVP